MIELEPSPQEEELQALRSIYGSDWEDIQPPKTAWKVAGEKGDWWAVTLRGADERVSVKLKGRFTKLYPKQPPLLSLEDPKALSPNQVQTLTKLVNEQAKALAQQGIGFVFDLAEFIVDWITNNHVPLPKPGEIVPTLMEEMAQREEAQRAAEKAQTQAELEQKRAQAEEQNRLLTQRIQLDTSRKAERANQAVAEEEEKTRQETLAALADGELELRELVLDEPIKVDGYDGQWSNWILFSGRRECLWTTYNAEPDGGDLGFVRASLPSITAQVVDFSKPYYSSAQGKKRIDAIAVEVARLRDLRSEHVTTIYGVKRDKSPKGWERLIVLVERVEGVSLRKWLPREGFGEDTAREYTAQILSGLAEIHRRGANQKQLDLDCVYLSTKVDGEPVVKLSGTGYARRIADLHRSNPFLKSYDDNIPESWLSPDEIDSPHTYSSKRDLWHSGLILVQMLFGAQVLWRYPNLHILLQHFPGVSESMTELLHGLLHPTHKKRLTADEALSRVQMVDETTRRGNRWSTGPVSIAPITNSPAATFGTSPVNGNYFSNTPMAPRQSRYRTDFEEVEFLGKGGFGEVVKARNKLDGRSYAIKKVKLRPEDNEQKVYREVNSLSRVSHQYIVRYYGCWLEDATPPDPTPPIEDGPTPTASASTEEDIFALNFDDLSFARRDQSRSASFPRIRFANSGEEEEDDDDSDNDTDSDSDAETAADPSEHRDRGRPMLAQPPQPIAGTQAKPSMSLTGTTTDDGSFQRILYIQMEFVEKQTLREAISASLSDDEVWRLLVQILQALAHMSSLGIVHRDLKPSNILLDANGNVKIADFGLSTTEITAVEPATTPTANDDYSDRTSGIGTSLYIAPEVAISRTYNEKADMYSLGIIFFEMCFAFKTHMERVHILTALRQPTLTFPVSWPKGVKENQREIVEWLLRHDPATRPQATQLLASPLLPAREMQKEYYDMAIAELTNTKSNQYQALLNALFDTSSSYNLLDNQIDDYTYDNEQDDELQVWLTVVIQRLTDLFQRHGAVETYLPLLIPETTLLNAFPDLSPVRLLDQAGKIVQLPSSDLLSMARSATRKQIERIKRYHVGYRYADHPAGGQPRVSGELSFDIISPIKSPVAEAEMLEMVDKVISEFRGIRGTAVDYEYHVSHEAVLAGILSTVPDRSRSSVLKAFKGIGSNLASSTSQTLLLSGISGLSRQIIDDLQQCCVVDEFNLVRSRIEAQLPSQRRKWASALDIIATIIALARACGVTRRILFRPTLSRNAEFFRGGFMFECVRRGKQREVIAFGGRYDSLMEHFKEPAQQMQSRRVYGVGMSIAVDQLARMVRKNESSLSSRLMSKDNEEERSYGFWSPARCDVYVASVSQVDMSARLSIVGELWRAGIKADLQYDDERSLEEVAAECLEQNTLYLVIPRANRPVLKVRSILRRSEEEVPRNELCNYLRQVIAEQRRIDATYASAEGSIPSAQAAALSVVGNGENRSEGEIKLVLPPEPGGVGTSKLKGKPVRKHRHATKSVYYDKASEFAAATKSSLPIIGVDLPTSLLSSLTLDPSWVQDDEAWRSVLSSAGVPNADRRYVESIREAVRDCIRSTTRSNDGLGSSVGPAAQGWIWLFSVREARGFLLQSK